MLHVVQNHNPNHHLKKKPILEESQPQSNQKSKLEALPEPSLEDLNINNDESQSSSTIIISEKEKKEKEKEEKGVEEIEETTTTEEELKILEGRPNYGKIFSNIVLDKNTRKVGVLACGPPPLVHSVQMETSKIGWHFHKETFAL